VTTPWAERVVSRGVLAVARSLGLAVTPPRNGTGGALHCPACHATTRHTKSSDRRLACDVTRNGRGWHCYQCDARGDALDAVAYRLRGSRFRELGDAARDDVRAWCAREWSDVGELLDAAARRAPAPSLPPLPTPTTTTPDAPPEYRTAEALAIWDACVAVRDDAEVLRYLTAPRAEGGRGLPDAAQFTKHVARALPLDLRPPFTLHKPDETKPVATWAETGYRLVLPTYDADGVHRSVLARAVVPVVRNSQGHMPRKSSTAGPRTGLVMANGYARAMLETGTLPDGERRIVVAEGEIDFLTLIARRERVVLGVFAGSWPRDSAIARRIPDRSTLLVWTHADAAGRKYAQDILDSVRDRVERGALTVRFASHFAVNGRAVTLKEQKA